MPTLPWRSSPFQSRPWTFMIRTVVISPHSCRFPLPRSLPRRPRIERRTPAPAPRPSRGGTRAGTHCYILCSSIACFICTYSCMLLCSGEGHPLAARNAVGGGSVVHDGSFVHVSRSSPISVSNRVSRSRWRLSRLSHCMYLVARRCVVDFVNVC